MTLRIVHQIPAVTGGSHERDREEEEEGPGEAFSMRRIDLPLREA